MSKFSLLYITADALESFTTAIEVEYISHGIEKPYNSLVRSAVDYSRLCTSAMNGYFVSADTEKFHREIIGATMEFLQIYDDWIESLQAPDLQHSSSKVFHSMILRYAKGALKAYRCWRIDLRK